MANTIGAYVLRSGSSACEFGIHGGEMVAPGGWHGRRR